MSETTQSTLFPGYRQVESFGPDEEYEEEEEVSYVTLDLPGSMEPTLVPSSSTYRLIGLDTPTPFLQLSGSIFKGQHHNLLGTELLFTDDHDHERGRRGITHVANTERRIRFKEVRLKPRDRSQPDDGAASEQPSGIKERTIGSVTHASSGSGRGRGGGGRPRGKGRGRGRGAKGRNDITEVHNGGGTQDADQVANIDANDQNVEQVAHIDASVDVEERMNEPMDVDEN